jgi:hypothetical protein
MKINESVRVGCLNFGWQLAILKKSKHIYVYEVIILAKQLNNILLVRNYLVMKLGITQYNLDVLKNIIQADTLVMVYGQTPIVVADIKVEE